MEKPTDPAQVTGPVLRTALVIDGDPLVGRSLAMILADEAFVVDVAPDGVQGIALAREKAFELIVVGAELPDMSGQEAVRQIRLTDDKVVIVTASVAPATAARAARLDLSACC